MDAASEILGAWEATSSGCTIYHLTMLSKNKLRLEISLSSPYYDQGSPLSDGFAMIYACNTNTADLCSFVHQGPGIRIAAASSRPHGSTRAWNKSLREATRKSPTQNKPGTELRPRTHSPPSASTPSPAHTQIPRPSFLWTLPA